MKHISSKINEAMMFYNKTYSDQVLVVLVKSVGEYLKHVMKNGGRKADENIELEDLEESKCNQKSIENKNVCDTDFEREIDDAMSMIHDDSVSSSDNIDSDISQGNGQDDESINHVCNSLVRTQFSIELTTLLDNNNIIPPEQILINNWSVECIDTVVTSLQQHSTESPLRKFFDVLVPFFDTVILSDLNVAVCMMQEVEKIVRMIEGSVEDAEIMYVIEKCGTFGESGGVSDELHKDDSKLNKVGEMDDSKTGDRNELDGKNKTDEKNELDDLFDNSEIIHTNKDIHKKKINNIFDTTIQRDNIGQCINIYADKDTNSNININGNESMHKLSDINDISRNDCIIEIEENEEIKQRIQNELKQLKNNDNTEKEDSSTVKNQISYEDYSQNNKIDIDTTKNNIGNGNIDNCINSEEVNNCTNSEEVNHCINSEEVNNCINSEELNNRINSEEVSNRINSEEVNHNKIHNHVSRKHTTNKQVFNNNTHVLDKSELSLIYTGLSKIIKPVIKFRAKEAINLIIHLALKSNNKVLAELITNYDSKPDYQLELFLYSAMVQKETKRNYTNDLKKAKDLMQTYLNNTADHAKLFLISKLISYLELEHDDELLRYFKLYVINSNENERMYLAKYMHKIIRFNNYINNCTTIDNSLQIDTNDDRSVSLEEVFSRVYNSDIVIQNMLFTNIVFFSRLSEIPTCLYTCYLEWISKIIKNNADNFFSYRNELVAASRIFIYFLRKYKNLETITLFFVLMSIDNVVAIAVIKPVLFEHISEIYDVVNVCIKRKSNRRGECEIDFFNMDAVDQKDDTYKVNNYTGENNYDFENSVFNEDNNIGGNSEHSVDSNTTNIESDIPTTIEINTLNNNGLSESEISTLEMAIGNISLNYKCITKPEPRKSIFDYNSDSVLLEINDILDGNIKDIDKKNIDLLRDDIYSIVTKCTLFKTKEEYLSKIQEYIIGLSNDTDNYKQILIKNLEILRDFEDSSKECVLVNLCTGLEDWRIKCLFIEKLAKQDVFLEVRRKEITETYMGDRIFFVRSVASDYFENYYK